MPYKLAGNACAARECFTDDIGDERGQIDAGRRDGVRELVNGTAMARHLCFERAYLDKLLDAGVLERDSNGKFDLDENRRRYILHLREERKRSPRSEADTDFQRAKSELIAFALPRSSGN